MRLPTNIVLNLKNRFNIKTFIETGTFKGRAAEWASDYFEKVFSVEMSETIFKKTKEKLNHISNIFLFNEDSVNFLKKIKSEIKPPFLFWLDAHFSGGETSGLENECPLLEELDIIQNYPEDKFIIIDDARFFCSTAPEPLKKDQWPPIDEVIEKLKQINPIVKIHKDVIISVPSHAKEILEQTLREENSRNKQTSDFQKTIFHFKNGLRHLLKSFKIMK